MNSTPLSSSELTLYYIHGYQSSPNSEKAKLFKKELHADAIKYRTGKPEDLDIKQALHTISNTIKTKRKVALIGSSLGGYLAAETARTHPQITTLILLNPAIIPPDISIDSLDNSVPRPILTHMKNPELFSKKLNCHISSFIGTEDRVVPNIWSITFARTQHACVQFLKDDHRFSKNITLLPDLIKTHLLLPHT